jgi:tetratricopeptide (TPR) repeat protein
MFPRKILRAAIASIMLVASSSGFAADSAIDEANALMGKGDAKGAYAVLAPLEAERAGNPEYDYLLGIAALDAGESGRAVFALERVLAVQPDHVQARAEIARAYLALGEVETAKNEFQGVSAQPVPPQVQASIQKYLQAIELLETADRPKISGYVELSAGYDSNVNSAISAGQVAIPALGGAIVSLSSSGVKAHDDFLSIGGGAKLRYPLTKETSVVGSVDANQRGNSSEDQFDTRSLAGSVGLNFVRGKHNFTALLQTQSFSVDNNRYRDANGLVGQWEYLPDDNRAISAYVQYARLEYPGQDIRNADRTVVGASYGQALGGSLAPVVFAGVYAGTERALETGVPYLGNDLVGVRVGGQLTVNPKTVIFASGSYEDRNYGGTDPFFLVGRDDQQSDLNIGVNYSPIKAWRVIPQISYTRNKSNVAINDYERSQFIVTVRRDFE